MQIFVKTHEGNTKTYEVSENQTIGSLSEMICEREQIPVEF